MTSEELVERFPRLYHVTTPGAWDAIRQHGLLSTEELLRRAGYPEAEVQSRIRRRRSDREMLDQHPLGRIVLNDNRPITRALAHCLDDELSPEDWLAELNRRVFFWVEPEKSDRLADAAINKSDPRETLVFRTDGIVASCGGRVQIAPINTGNTRRQPARRGRTTFTPLDAMPYAQWQRLRGLQLSKPKLRDEVVEVVVVGGVLDIERHLIERRGA